MNIVLGASGMLGRYLVKNIDSIGLYSSTFKVEPDFVNFDYLFKYKPTCIINCIGVIKPQIEQVGTAQTIFVNSVFPHLLAAKCQENNCKLIHITTDCVYSGNRGDYNEKDILNVHDLYGVSKFYGEPPDSTVIRTSIIGEEVFHARSLVEWCKKSHNTTVNGFSNHIWNGVTCLELSKIIKNILDNNLYWAGVRHIFSNKVSKCTLLNMISDAFQLNLTVTPTLCETFCDRSLDTIHTPIETSPLKQQIQELAQYSPFLYE